MGNKLISCSLLQESDFIINITFLFFQLLKTLGKIDFKAIACNDDILVKHIIFQKNADVTAISQNLCAIEDHLISNITNEIVRQLDAANLIRIVSICVPYSLTIHSSR